MSFAILTIYSAVIKDTQSITIDNPSIVQFEELHHRYSATLSCPCKHLSITYETIMNIQPIFHQVCSSSFIQDDGWLQYWPILGISQTTANTPVLATTDFRVVGQIFFKLLQTYCNLARETINTALDVFNATQFVTSKVLASEIFKAQTSILFAEFTEQTLRSFLVTFQLLSHTIRLNQLIVDGATNVGIQARVINGSWKFLYGPKSFRIGTSNCTCGMARSCQKPQGFYCQSKSCLQFSSIPNRTILGMFVGCSPIDSILLSTLECFYNQSCIQMIIDSRSFEFPNMFIPVNLTNIIALNRLAPSQFFPATSLETIILQLMIENWTTSINYNAYFSQCQPNSCTYTLIRKNKPILIITNVIGLVGGLTVALRLLVPYLVKVIQHVSETKFKRSSINTNTDNQSICSPIMFIRRNIQKLNVFEKEMANVNQILATRIYFFLLLISLIIVALFLGLSQRTYSYTVDSPSELQISSLRSQYPTTLNCPCSQIAIRYATFVTLSPVVHQICSSSFVSSNFSALLLNKGDRWVDPDWYLLSAHFRLLSSMCELTQMNLNQSISEFVLTELISTEAFTIDQFQVQISSAMENFIKKVPLNFRRLLSFILNTFRANQIQDQYMSSWITDYTTANESYIMRTIPTTYNNNTCVCASGITMCSRSIRLLDLNNQIITLEGISIGCLPIFGLRQSTLECLFDKKCLDKLIKALGYPIILEALNSSINTQYSSKTTPIGDMIDNLFIELWINTSNYSNYFRQCSPLVCQYSYVERNNFLYLLTTLLGLYGGLTVALRLIVWHGFKLLQPLFLRHRRSAQISP